MSNEQNVNTDEQKGYTLPLAPQDLVSIYKEKEDNEKYVLFVDYVKTREKLSADHVIIYLANTNFKTSFDVVDEDLLKAYITSDFLIDCPLLARVIANIIKVRLSHELNPLDEQLLNVFSMESIHEFIKHNYELLEELIFTIQSVIPFTMSKLYDQFDQETKDLEVDLKEYVNDIEVVDKPIKCGPNIARLLTTSWDAFLLITHVYGLSTTYNKSLYNDTPKYFGSDLYFVLNETNIVKQIIGFFPPWFFQTIDIKPFEEDENEEIDFDADNKE